MSEHLKPESSPPGALPAPTAPSRFVSEVVAGGAVGERPPDEKDSGIIGLVVLTGIFVALAVAGDIPKCTASHIPIPKPAFCGIIFCSVWLKGVPFEGCSVSDIKEMVLEGKRPDIPLHCRGSVRKVIEQCWSEDPSRRPSFDDLVSTLESGTLG